MLRNDTKTEILGKLCPKAVVSMIWYIYLDQDKLRYCVLSSEARLFVSCFEMALVCTVVD